MAEIAVWIISENEFWKDLSDKHISEVLRQITPPHMQGFEEIADWAYNHHEKLNGTGYAKITEDIAAHL